MQVFVLALKISTLWTSVRPYQALSFPRNISVYLYSPPQPLSPVSLRGENSPLSSCGWVYKKGFCKRVLPNLHFSKVQSILTMTVELHLSPESCKAHRHFFLFLVFFFLLPSIFCLRRHLMPKSKRTRASADLFWTYRRLLQEELGLCMITLSYGYLCSCADIQILGSTELVATQSLVLEQITRPIELYRIPRETLNLSFPDCSIWINERVTDDNVNVHKRDLISSCPWKGSLVNDILKYSTLPRIVFSFKIRRKGAIIINLLEWFYVYFLWTEGLIRNGKAMSSDILIDSY